MAQPLSSALHSQPARRRHGAVIARALSGAALLAVALAACGEDGGEENLRPKILTPAVPKPSMCTGVPDEELPVPAPPTAVTYVSGPAQDCGGPQFAACGTFGTPAPASGVMIPFASYTDSGSWGTADGIQGGTSLYQGTPSEAITQTVVGDTLNIRANILVGGYTGIVLWFQPCVNASAFSGLRFPATGTLSGATMIVKAQTSPDYPVDVANSKGKCPFMVQANQFTECQQPFTNITALPAGEVTLPWSSFAGGAPLGQVDERQLLGFELQFQCPQSATAPCALDLNLGTVSFLP